MVTSVTYDDAELQRIRTNQYNQWSDICEHMVGVITRQAKIHPPTSYELVFQNGVERKSREIVPHVTGVPFNGKINLLDDGTLVCVRRLEPHEQPRKRYQQMMPATDYRLHVTGVITLDHAPDAHWSHWDVKRRVLGDICSALMNKERFSVPEGEWKYVPAVHGQLPTPADYRSPEGTPIITTPPKPAAEQRGRRWGRRSGR